MITVLAICFYSLYDISLHWNGLEYCDNLSPDANAPDYAHQYFSEKNPW